MDYSNEAFVMMLLTLALSPDREEYAHPLSASEFRRLQDKVRASEIRDFGKLLEQDISGLMIRLDLPEAEAYRIYTLLHRDVQLEYAIENLISEGIEIVTACNSEYPKRIRGKMNYDAPPVYYRAGEAQLISKPLLAIAGIGGIRTSTDDRMMAETLVREGVAHGYTILTGGEPGISRVVMNSVLNNGGTLVEVLAGGMSEHIKDEMVAELISEKRAAVLSIEHPGALFTIPHAANRNKMIFSLAEAVFVFNTDGKRAEADAARNRLCTWIYAKKDCRANEALLSKGASPFSEITSEGFAELSRHWAGSRSEQLDLFGLLGDE